MDKAQTKLSNHAAADRPPPWVSKASAIMAFVIWIIAAAGKNNHDLMVELMLSVGFLMLMAIFIQLQSLTAIFADNVTKPDPEGDSDADGEEPTEE